MKSYLVQISDGSNNNPILVLTSTSPGCPIPETVAGFIVPTPWTNSKIVYKSYSKASYKIIQSSRKCTKRMLYLHGTKIKNKAIMLPIISLIYM